MSCLSALRWQIATLFSMPEDVVLLRHKVFREYAKVAIGPDFIHTLPSILMLTAALLVLWKNPPSSARIMDFVGVTFVYKVLQVSVSWLVINALLWLWLILQRILYCSVWRYWSYESEYRNITYHWWQRVWSSYYPAPIEPPMISADFISWIVAMSIAVITLTCVIYINPLETFIKKTLSKLENIITAVQSCMEWSQERAQGIFLTSETNVTIDDSEAGSVGEDSHSETPPDASNAAREIIHPISYGTNWVPQPNFTTFKEAQRKISMKSFPTAMGANDIQDPDKFMTKQMRNRRGCHTLIPSNTSEQSSGC